MRTSLGHFFINHIFDKLLKLPKTIEEQIALLDERGIGIDDYNQLRDTLINNNYYRLMGYMFQFKIDEESYTKGIKFSQIFGIYNFDKSLRQLISPLLEIIEISFRTKIAYFMCHKYGCEFYMEESIFQNNRWYSDFISTVDRCIKQSESELFIKHHLKKYDGRFPFWVLIEILSFTTISKFFKNINTADKNEFSRFYFRYDSKIIENWIQHFSIIRNICAHYGRLYNKNLFPKLKLLKEDNFIRTMKIFDSLFILNKLIENRSIWSDFLKKINSLLIKNKDDIDFKLIGFPDNYLTKLK